MAALHAGAQRPFWLTASLKPKPLRLLDEFPGGVEILGERLLGEDVLSRGESFSDERRTHVRMGGDVNDLDLRIAEELGEIVEHLDAVRLPDFDRRLGAHVIHADDPLPVPRIARQMRRTHDRPAAHDADPRTVRLREARACSRDPP